MNGFAPNQSHTWRIAVITGVENDDFIIRMDYGLNGGKKANRCTWGDGNFSHRVKLQSDRVAQIAAPVARVTTRPHRLEHTD